MKTFISKVKNLKQRAEDLRAAMEKAPATIAEIRESVAATAGQLHQLRTEVQSSVAGLKLDGAERMSQALQEINTNLDVFLQAGFEVNGVDLEISPVQRLLVHLRKLEDVHPSQFRSLLNTHQQRKTVHALLTALVQAQRMADKVEFAHLDYDELIVGLGPIPSIRICWHAEEIFEAEHLATPVVAPAPSTTSAFGQSSFFEKRSSQPAAAATPSFAATPSPGQTDEPARSEPLSGDWKRDTLERFKKDPHFSKYRR